MLEWDHNAYYQTLLLRHLPARCGPVLDVGCGAGAFAARLAGVCDHVDALDRSPQMLELAQRRVPSNVRCILADVLVDPLPAGAYDAIVSISALHHMPFDTALRRAVGGAAARWDSRGRRLSASRPACRTAC